MTQKTQIKTSPNRTVALAVLVGLLYFIYKSNEVRYIQSEFDSNFYVVLNKYDSKNAADLLARIRQNLTLLQKHLESNYSNDKVTKHIQKRFNPNNISEGSPDSQYTSYTINMKINKKPHLLWMGF